MKNFLQIDQQFYYLWKLRCGIIKVTMKGFKEIEMYFGLKLEIYDQKFMEELRHYASFFIFN